MTLPAAAPVALYVHVPFCLSVCPYCDYVVYGGRAARRADGLISRFVEAVVAEIRLRGEEACLAFGPSRPSIGSVYLGGGTPSLLRAADVARVLDAADRAFGVAADAEVTLEVNPGAPDRGDVRGFRAAGVNRLSIGAQSMSAAELRRLGRRHATADIVATMRLARRARFDSVSVDLLYDLPDATLDDWRRTLAATLALEPDHVSAYALTLELDDADPGALSDRLPVRPGALGWRRRVVRRQDEDRAAAAYRMADRRLAAAGLEWYEISNWARPGRASRHNMAYWRSLAHAAVGPGAHAFDGALTRRWNAARLDGYLAALVPADGTRPALPPGGSERVDPATAAADAAILRLRTREGLDATTADDPAFSPAIAWAKAHRLLAATERDSIRLTLRGRLLANELFARLLDGALAAAA